MKRLENKVAIVTGSGAGIGKETARTYAKEGAKVVIADFNEAALNETEKELSDAGYEAFGVVVNVAKKVDVGKMFDETVERFGKIDIVVNNAVVGMTKNVASQYGADNIRCNTIAPGQIQTGFAAAMDNVDQAGMKSEIRGVDLVPKPGEVQDVANIELFLASEESSYINGVLLTADDGRSAY